MEPGRYAGEQVWPGLPPAEQGHLGSGPQSIRHDGPAYERRTAKNENPHRREHYRQPGPAAGGGDAYPHAVQAGRAAPSPNLERGANYDVD